MVFVVNKVFKSSQCPMYLMSLSDSFSHALGYAFADESSLEKFSSSVAQKFRHMKKKHPGISFRHDRYYSRSHADGEHRLLRSGVMTVAYHYNSGTVVLLRLQYFRLLGHVAVSFDGLTLRQEPFIREGGSHV